MTSRRSTSVLAGLALAAHLCGAARAGDTTYTYVDLGTLGGPESVAMGLNDAGQVVGWSSIPGCTVNGHPCRRAFLWEDGVMTDLGVLAGDEESVARAINSVGMIVGTSERDAVAASTTAAGFSWSLGAMSALPDLGASGSTFAHDVNDAGVIVGHSLNAATLRDTSVTWQGGAITDVGGSEPHSYNRAYGINAAGVLVGFAWNLFAPNDATLFDGFSWATIGGAGGPFQNAQAHAVNSTGVVVGLQAFPSGAWHPAMWTFGSPGGTDLGTLPGHDIGEMFDVNEAGQAVGHTWLDIDPGTSRAVLYDGATLIDLNDVLAPGTNATLFEAREVNEQGDIVGTAIVNGLFRAFLLEAHDTEAWTDLGFALAGSAGEPQLSGTGVLAAGETIELALTSAQPSAAAYWVLGVARLDLPFKGGTLVPAFAAPLGMLVGFNTDSAGELTLSAPWPAGLPSGIEVTSQFWISDPGGPVGFAASNAVTSTTL